MYVLICHNLILNIMLKIKLWDMIKPGSQFKMLPLDIQQSIWYRNIQILINNRFSNRHSEIVSDTRLSRGLSYNLMILYTDNIMLQFFLSAWNCQIYIFICFVGMLIQYQYFAHSNMEDFRLLRRMGFCAITLSKYWSNHYSNFHAIPMKGLISNTTRCISWSSFLINTFYGAVIAWCPGVCS